ncbi:MAG TPA: condensation domain-containing protein [Xanthobacteraceae bacterium]|nr:condensation domain-containing protein [Xanthobacteraceae bacterium]
MLDQPALKQKVSAPVSSLYDLLQGHARRFAEAPAILAPDCAPLSYRRLYRHIDDIGRALRVQGIGRDDRLAVLMPNGPELAVAIVAVAANAACASINPAYSAEELDRYFADLRPRALIVPAGVDGPARRVAQARGLPVFDLKPTGEAAGLFTLAGRAAGEPSSDPIGPGAIALFLFTSGTTSRPKIVPLTHGNICSSALSAVAALRLSEADRCLNVLPLFHGHGLIATVMTSLAAGAGVVCTPGCDVIRFFGWLREFAPTWYSAVPTMHQAILAQARLNPDQVAGVRLRLVRSASAPLPPRVLAELEQTFGTSVIEFYGMTETASAPIACNPLPPRKSKPGSVGIQVGLDVAILDDRGDVLPAGEVGHVTARGPSVMPGYDGDAAATAAAFTGDWFKTGDQGFFDDEGYLYLSGRTREMINRGGENIAPREVDEALLEHPAVAEAVTFAVPHATLGEDVAAAVVLRPNADATAKDIRQFAAGRLADFKVPRQVLIVAQLPKGSTGKVQRIGLAEKLGLAGGSAASRTFAAPRTSLENILAGIWADVLHLEQVGIHDDFFALGGDSLLAAHVLTSIHDAMHLEVGVVSLFDAPTVAEMAEYLETLIKAGRAGQLEIARVSRDELLPASPAQVRLWTLQQAVPDLPFFNILYALRITSPLDAKVLERSLDEIVRRHEILRTTIDVAGGRKIQIIAPQLMVPLAVDDLRKLSTSKREAATHRFIQAELLHSFDLARGPLIRARVVRLVEEEHLLLIAMHQTIADGGSLGVIADELATLYEAFAAGKVSPLPPLPIQYADFAAWQCAWTSHSDVAAQLDYWREQLRDPLPALQLGAARPWRAESKLTAQRDIALPASLSETLKQFSRREGGTLFMALVAALKTLLHRYAGENDLRLATNVANRNRAGTEGLIGPLANTVILRTDLGGDPTAREVMRRVRATTLKAYAHQDLPFEVVAETLARERGVDPAKLAQVMILLHNAALRPQTSAGRALAFEEADPGMPMPLVTTTTYDVILSLRETAQGLMGSCIYQPHLFGSKWIDRLLADFQKILEHMASEPERRISTIRFSRKVSAKHVTT